MILFCVKTRNGEDEYENYGYYETFTVKDFASQKLTDLTILSEHYDYKFTDKHEENEGQYWYGDKIVWVEGVWKITPEELKTLHKFGIIYYKGGQQ